MFYDSYLLFYVPLKISSIILYHCRWRAKKKPSLCSALRAFEQGEIFIMSYLLWHGASSGLIRWTAETHSVASYDTHGDVEDLFLPGFSRVPLQSPLATYMYKGMLRTYSYPDPHGPIIYRCSSLSTNNTPPHPTPQKKEHTFWVFSKQYKVPN
jgi:hypothetical protein